MNRGAWQTAVHGGRKELDTTEKLSTQMQNSYSQKKKKKKTSYVSFSEGQLMMNRKMLHAKECVLKGRIFKSENNSQAIFQSEKPFTLILQT